MHTKGIQSQLTRSPSTTNLPLNTRADDHRHHPYQQTPKLSLNRAHAVETHHDAPLCVPIRTVLLTYLHSSGLCPATSIRQRLSFERSVGPSATAGRVTHFLTTRRQAPPAAITFAPTTLHEPHIPSDLRPRLVSIKDSNKHHTQHSNNPR